MRAKLFAHAVGTKSEDEAQVLQFAACDERPGKRKKRRRRTGLLIALLHIMVDSDPNGGA